MTAAVQLTAIGLDEVVKDATDENQRIRVYMVKSLMGKDFSERKENC